MLPLRNLRVRAFVCLSRRAATLFVCVPVLWLYAGTPASGRAVHSTVPSTPTLTSEPKLTIVEFTDFKCPYCSKMVPVMDEVLKSHPGKVRLIVKDFPLEFHPGAQLAHEACLAAKAQGKYWEMYHLLFGNQQHLEKADLVDYAKQLHMDLTRFENALDSHRYSAEVRESVAEGRALGVTATPTFFMHGRKLEGAQSAKSFEQRVRAELGEDEPSKPEVKQVEAIAADAPVRGSPEAPVTITEYADFECPFCAQSAGSINAVLREYPGRVKLVFKSFPLSFHEDSRLAHQAALAAAQQGKFWEMHDLIFARQRTMKRDDLFVMAKTLGLNMDRFAKALESEQIQAQIDAEQAEGKGKGVQGTPTFYIDDKPLEGAASVAQFEARIDQSLRAKGIEPSRVPNEGENGPARGPEHAAVTVLWYSDVTSSLAIPADHLMEQVLDAYAGEVRVVFKNRPLEFHREAILAHQALMAAAAQGKFWPMHRVLLANQNALSANDLVNYAVQIGIDTQKFTADLSSSTLRDQVQREVSEAREAGVNGVPVFFINGARVDGVQSFAKFRAMVDAAIQKTRVAVVHE